MTRIAAQRRNNTRPLRKKFVLIVEGQETEFKYVSAVAKDNRHANYDLRILTPGTSPGNLFKEALKMLDLLDREGKLVRRGGEASDVGEVWIVCDVDDNGDDLKALQARSESNRIKWAISNPCFDIWLGMHLAEVTGFMDRKEIQRRLKAKQVLVGSKSKTPVMDKLRGNYQTAKNCALAFERSHAGINSFPENNPSSNVHLLVDALNPDWE